MQFVTTIDIDAPPDVVWQVLSAVEHWPQWTKSVTEIKWVEGSTGLTPGAKARIKQPSMPALVWTVTECDAGTSFDWQTKSPGLKTLATHRLSGTSQDRTEVTLRIKQSGALAGIVGGLSANRTKRHVLMEAEGLKSASEAAARSST